MNIDIFFYTFLLRISHFIIEFCQTNYFNIYGFIKTGSWDFLLKGWHRLVIIEFKGFGPSQPGNMANKQLDTWLVCLKKKCDLLIIDLSKIESMSSCHFCQQEWLLSMTSQIQCKICPEVLIVIIHHLLYGIKLSFQNIWN